MNPILRNETSKVNWNITLNSVHAVAYRLWTKQDGEDWKVIADGKLSDDVIDAGSFSAVKGTEFAYWLGIGSDKPKSTFNISIVLAQDNVILINGMMNEKGRVNDDGIAQRLKEVTFK